MKKATSYFLLLVVLVVFSLAVSCQPEAPPPTEDRAPAFELKADILGRTHTISLDNGGRLLVSAELASADGVVMLSIDRDTGLLDKGGKPLSSIWIETEPEQLAPPEDASIISTVYSLGPQDAVFDRPLKLTLSYDKRELPEQVRENDVNIVPYNDSSGWGESYYKRLDTENHRVTTQITHFGRYAVMAPLVAVSPLPTTDVTPTVKVDLLYFHRSQRCTKCLCFEERVSHVVNEYFEDEINSGQLTFQVLNIGDKENAALVRKYGAVGSQLFINTIINGDEHIRDVQEIWSWDCTGNTDRFDREVRNTIELSLKGEQ